VALLQPALETIEAADISRCGLGGAVLQQLAAGDGLAFFFQPLLKIGQPEQSAAGQAPGGHLADALLTQAAAAVAELLQQFSIDALAAGLGNAAQQGLDFLLIRQR